MKRGTAYRAIAGACALLGLAWGAMADEIALDPVRATYVELCGGCHGIQGVSAVREVPRLRGRVSWFLCTKEGREYLIRLPNVAHAPLEDEEVAALMNFVVFGLGANGNRDFPLYTPEEIARLRARPLTGDGLSRLRERLVAQLIAECGAPRDLRDYAGPSGLTNSGRSAARTAG